MLLRARCRTSDKRWGVAATELAIILPFLIFLWVIAIDWARIFYYTVTVQYAARDGAYCASNYPGIYSYDTDGNGQLSSTEIQNAALGEATNITPTPTVVVGYDTIYNGTYSSSSPTGANFVQVRVTYTFNTITNFPGVPNATVITRTERMAIAPIVPEF